MHTVESLNIIFSKPRPPHQELSAAYQKLSDSEGRATQLAREMANMRAELAARTPPGARTNEVVRGTACLTCLDIQLFSSTNG
jgi:hypothetical protein